MRPTRRTRKDGPVDVDVRAVPIRVGHEMVGLYAIYHDISELQRAREQAGDRHPGQECVPGDDITRSARR